MPYRPSYVSNDTWGRATGLEMDDLLEQGMATLKMPTMLEDGIGSLREIASSFSTSTPTRTAPLPMIQTPIPEPTPVKPPDYTEEFAEYDRAAGVSNIPGPEQGPGGTPISVPRGAPARPGVTAQKGEIDNSSREAFIRSAYPWALEAADGDAALANQLVATAISENGKVGTGRSLGEMGFNVGGIQGVQGPAGSFTALDAGRPRQFAAYNNLSEGFRAVKDLVASGRYQAAYQRYRQTGDVDQFWSEVNQEGYAEDKTWHTKVGNIRRGQVEPLTRQVTAAPRPGPTTPPQAEQTPAAQRQAPTSLTGITPPQFGLGDADADAICGPVLAMAFAKSNGRNPTIAEAKEMARKAGGWTSAQGMGGPEAMAATLRAMNIPATYKPGPLDVDTIRRETQNGNPVGINTRGHYFVVEGVDEQGRLNLGNSASNALRTAAGRQWFFPHEIGSLGMGAPTGAIYKDAPSSPTPSVAVRETGMPPAAPNAGATPPVSAAAAPAGEPPAPAGASLDAARAAPVDGSLQMRQPLGPELSPGNESGGYRPEPYAREISPLQPALTGVPPYQQTMPPYRNRPVPGVVTEWTERPDAPPEGEYVGPVLDAPADPPDARGYQTVQFRQPLGQQPELPVDEPYDPRMVDEGPREDTNRTVIGQNIPGPDLSPQGTPITAPAPRQSWEYDQPPSVPANFVPPSPERELRGIGMTENVIKPALGWAGENVIKPVLETLDAANEWVINSPLGNINLQAAGREIAGADQLAVEFGEDHKRLEALVTRWRNGDQSVVPEMQALSASLNQRMQTERPYRETLLEAGERNPDKRAELLGSGAQAAATIALAPSLSSGVVRNVAAAALDPVGQAIGGGIEGTVRAVGAAPALLTRGRELVDDASEGAIRAWREGAERAAGLNQQPAGASTFGTLGVSPDEQVMRGLTRPQVVPPHVADQMDFPVRIPDDPRTIRAIEAAGGTVDPERGVTLGVTRRQSPAGAGQTATRGGVFYEAVPEGGRSSYSPVDDPNSVGGSQEIPRTETRFRSPLVLDAPPGEPRGFDGGMRQLSGPRVAEAEQAWNEAEQAYRATVAKHGGNLDTLRANRDAVDVPDAFEVYDEAGKLVHTAESRVDAVEWGERHGMPSPRISRVPAGDVQPWRDADAALQEVFRARQRISEARKAVQEAQRPVTAQQIDAAIKEARAAGPHGSTARAQALKDLVSRYGGDPDLIDDLLSIRGADASESAWAIKENILAANARRQRYDGVVTVQAQAASLQDVKNHPKVKAAEAKWVAAEQAEQTAFREADRLKVALDAQDPARRQEISARAMQGDEEAQAALSRMGKGEPTRREEYEAAWQRYEQASGRTRQAMQESQAAELQARNDLSSAKITELMDPREARNPTPGEPDMAARNAANQAYDVADEEFNRARSAFYMHSDPEGADGRAAKAAMDAARDRLLIAQGAVEQADRTHTGTPGFMLRADVPRQPGAQYSTLGVAPEPGTSAARPRLAPEDQIRPRSPIFAGVGARANAEALNAAGGAVAGNIMGGTDPFTNPDAGAEDIAANSIAGAVGAVGLRHRGRLARAGARRAGQSADTSGALGVFGTTGRPASEAAAAAPNPTMQQMARQMAGQHTPSSVTNKRGLLERWAQAMTDDRAGIRNFQEAVSRSIGRPLMASESVAELTRVNPASVASQRIDEGLRTALQDVGPDEDYLAQYLVHTHNVDVAREIGQRAYDAAIKAGRSPQAASQAAVRASNTRQFSGDLRLADTMQQLQEIEQRVLGLPEGADRWQAIKDGAQSVWDFNRQTLERKKDAGIISDDLFNELTSRYPKYVRTDIADYFDKGTSGPAPAGRRLGLSDIGIQKISPEGTAKERVNPLLSTIDATYSAEASIARNEAGKAFEELLRLDPAWQSTFKEVMPAQGVNRGNPATSVPSSYTLRNREQFLRVWDGGQARTYVVPPEYAALVSPQTGRVLGDSGAAKLLTGAMNVYKQLITSKNPAFALVVSPVRDAGDYAIREATLSAKNQGPLGVAQAAGALPGIMLDYARAVPDAFAGILEGVYKGDLARMMREGAGQGGRPGVEQKELRQALGDLQRTGGMDVRSAGDMLKLVGNVLTLGAGPIGNRLEQVPRLAAAQRAARRGAEPLGQAMSFRDATVDFQRAGEWSRVANTIVPFFNVAMQSGAQTVRTFRANPAAFMSAVAATVGTASLAAEAWNNADEQRATDYGDVPDYLKRTGIVLMLPGVEGQSERGDRLPNYAWVPTGQYGALVQTAKEAAKNYVSGEGGADLSSPRGWLELGAEVAGIFSPIRGDSAGAVLSSVVPPVLSTGVEIAANKDLFRGSTIATDRRDENASAISQGSAAAFNAASGAETRASQWEYLYRDLGGYGATMALETSNLLAQKLGERQPKDEERPIQNTPVVGGLVNRVVRDAGGQRLETATEDEQRVPEGIRSVLEEAGLRRDAVTVVPSKWQGAQLTRAEQERWQNATNSLIGREVAAVRRTPEWRERGADKEKLVRDAIADARERAAERARLPDDREIQKRVERERRRKAG